MFMFIQYNYYSIIIMYPIMFISVMMTLISNSWFSLWLIMEINLISFISMILFDKNIKYFNVMIYFLIQSMSSLSFLLFSMMNFYFMNNIYLNLIIIMVLLVKLGIPPFHYWFISLSKNLNWLNFFFLCSIQKYIPLYTLSLKFNNNNLYILSLLLLIMMIMIIMSFLNINSNNLKVIFCYSSIIQITWIVIFSILFEQLMINYFLCYSIMIFFIYISLMNYNINYINNLLIMKFKNKMFYFIFILNQFSLASLPPFFGFINKLMFMQMLSLNIPFFMILFLIISTLFSLYFYLKITFTKLMIYNMSNKFKFKYLNLMLINNNEIFWIMLFIMFISLIFYEIN